jgi:hypothetical protein
VVQILAGILYVIAGVCIISHPYLAEVIFTVVIAISLIMNGAMRIVPAFLHRRFVSWLALVFSGVITMITWPLHPQPLAMDQHVGHRHVLRHRPDLPGNFLDRAWHQHEPDRGGDERSFTMSRNRTLEYPVRGA